MPISQQASSYAPNTKKTATNPSPIIQSASTGALSSISTAQSQSFIPIVSLSASQAPPKKFNLKTETTEINDFSNKVESEIINLKNILDAIKTKTFKGVLQNNNNFKAIMNDKALYIKIFDKLVAEANKKIDNLQNDIQNSKNTEEKINLNKALNCYKAIMKNIEANQFNIETEYLIIETNIINIEKIVQGIIKNTSQNVEHKKILNNLAKCKNAVETLITIGTQNIRTIDKEIRNLPKLSNDLNKKTEEEFKKAKNTYKSCVNSLKNLLIDINN